VKALLVYESDEVGGRMEKRTKVIVFMKLYINYLQLSFYGHLLQRIQCELRICVRLNHPNILPIYGYTHGFGRLVALVCPWVDNGNLTTYLERKDATLTQVK
jgi:serine/threonine protein kinase